MTKPLCVVISDIHFNLNTLSIASAALKAALDKAAELGIPTVIAGDLQDTKAIIRGEVANALILLLNQAKTPVYILVGNHDLINEKGDSNALNYLAPYVHIIDDVDSLNHLDLWCIPYQSNSDNLKSILSTIPSASTIICHQGFLGAAMGDYIQDKSSIDPEVVKDFTVISGHYHRHQTIGTVTYIGSPYTITFGEANDGPKGFLVLNSDGSYTREILKLRKHIIYTWNLNDLVEPTKNHGLDDKVWIKITGNPSELKAYDKKGLGDRFVGHQNFKLDLIPLAANKIEIQVEALTDTQMFDKLIETLDESSEQRTYLKGLFREVTQGTDN